MSAPASTLDTLAALRRYWGYDSFRPLQERIVASLLVGRDVCVVMPTGGGKSLCYQLPAAMSEGKIVVVVSPLIALMQDQMQQLAQRKIPAEALNSFVSASEQTEIAYRAASGKLRLLYLSPERLARQDTVALLKRMPIAFFAIDEAHCISEWGHEFRPEYRQLSSLRAHFPECPIAAFTASATRQVRHDIVQQLHLRDPDKYIASFRRGNLEYIVKECQAGTQMELLEKVLARYRDESVIVYSPTIRRVGETVEFLKERGISALGYHGKMERAERTRNQEKWTSGKANVLVGTIAFGMGVDKAAVRAVIHLSLPKSIEQYYQEAGRAGRDGLPAQCFLLWQKRDTALLVHFIQQIQDPAEKKRAWSRYEAILNFVEAAECRHHQICAHFGENPKWNACDACDVCHGPLAWLTATAYPVKKKRRSKSTGSRNGGCKPSPQQLETLRLYKQGHDFAAIAAKRGVKLQTTVTTIADMVESGELSFDERWVSSERQKAIQSVYVQIGGDRLKPWKDALPEEITYDEIRLVVAKIRHRASPQQQHSSS